jgi:hypothetical protein
MGASDADGSEARATTASKDCVDRPESRKRLDKENPALVAARDKAVVEMRKERIQKELLVRSQSLGSVHR